MKEATNSALTVIGCKKKFVGAFTSLAAKYDKRSVFSDFALMAAASISNSSDTIHFDEREKMYNDIAARYTDTENSLFSEMLLCVMYACILCEDKPRDIFGELFHDLALNNKGNGQFFTPQPICDFMGEMQLLDAEEEIKNKGYFTVSDPCVGGGAMILGLAKAMANNKYDFHTQMLVTAVDIDLTCVCMAYIQFALYGIPAVVVHGNSLTVEEWSHWYTPEFVAMKLQHPDEQEGETICTQNSSALKTTI